MMNRIAEVPDTDKKLMNRIADLPLDMRLRIFKGIWDKWQDNVSELKCCSNSFLMHWVVVDGGVDILITNRSNLHRRVIVNDAWLCHDGCVSIIQPRHYNSFTL